MDFWSESSLAAALFAEAYVLNLIVSRSYVLTMIYVTSTISNVSIKTLIKQNKNTGFMKAS
jgi:hypothetical protein